MKAILRTRYGSIDAVQFADAAKPSPADDELLIRVRAASINPLDLFLIKGMPWNRFPGLRKPKYSILGCDVAGHVEAIGKAVKQFRVGDEVFGVTGFEGKGFAEYACAPEKNLALKPASLSFEDAAAIPIAAVTALQGLRDHGQIQSGQRILVEGASGGVGTFAVQLARIFGAEVTVVCSTRNVDLVRSLGANHIINYEQADFTRTGQQFDLILGVNAHHSISDYRRILTKEGTYVAVGGSAMKVIAALLASRLPFGRKKVTFFIAKINPNDLAFLADLAVTGKLRPVIGKRHPISDAREALRYLSLGHARGKIVLNLPD